MKLFKIIFLILLFISSFLTIANAGSGPASIYKIQIFKIEFCNNTSTLSSCNGADTVYDDTAGNGSGWIDIASTTAGAAAASLGNISKLEFGKEYTHMQVTMSREFKLSGSAADGSGTTCYTDANGTDSEAATGSETAGDQTEVTLYAAFVSAGLSDGFSGMSSVTDSTPQINEVEAGDTHFQKRMAFDNSFVLKAGKIPTIKVAFGTDTATGATGNMDDGGGDGCGSSGASKGMYAGPPDVSVSWQ